MLRTSTRLCVLTGAALLAGSIAFADETGIDTLVQSQRFLSAALFQEQNAGKGDRLSGVRSVDHLISVSIVEVVGISQATVILRSGDGEVLYRSDPRSGITAVSKNIDLPILTMKEEDRSPTVQHPPLTTRREGGDEPRKGKRKSTLGCMGDVSPLVSASADRSPSLCLASLGRPLS